MALYLNYISVFVICSKLHYTYLKIHIQLAARLRWALAE